MASKLLDRLRRTLFKEGEVSKEDGVTEEFPESSELEDDTEECVSERLGGTLCFDGESALESEDAGDGSGLDSDSDFLGESVEEGLSSTDTSPIGPSPSGPSSLLTRQLQESWRSLRHRSNASPAAPVQEKLQFEVTDASVVHETSSKYVLYTIHVIQTGMSDKTPAVITRRYSDFERLHGRLRRHHGDEMERVCFPRKKLRKNFVAETIAKRSRAFEQYLTHLHSLPALRASPTFLEFFYLGDLRAGQVLMRVGRYQEALGPLLNALRLQEKLDCSTQTQPPHHHHHHHHHPPPPHLQQRSHWLFTVLALVTCFQEVEMLGEAQEHCDRALQDLVPPTPTQGALWPATRHPLLIPLLQTNVRLSWKLSRDKRRWEELLQELAEGGVDLGAGQLSLKEFLIKEELMETEGEGKARGETT